MKLSRNSMGFLAWAALLASVFARPPEASTVAPPVDVCFIPRTDLARSPDYAASGVFLPLSELLDLADQQVREAQHIPR